MINKEAILYERTISSSYMKLPALKEETLDVRILLQRKLKGMIPVERCYMNGEGQYWYDISGKQALDSFVKVNALEYSLFEILILRICEQLEVLEWNLLDVNGMILDPEFIFLNHKAEEISFVFYPQKDKNIVKDLQNLLEYLLSKLNHTDSELVQGAYELYELSLSESCQIQDFKNVILKRRMTQKKVCQVEKEYQVEFSEPLRVAESESTYGKECSVESKGSWLQEQLEGKLSALYKRAKDILVRYPKEKIPEVVYPEDVEEQVEVSSHPTICIATTLGEPRGVLIYEGMGDYPDFELQQMMCVIGKSARARFQIQRETISNFHAKIEYQEGEYYIEDMNSTNGTFINDEILNYRDKRILNPGDVIRFADIKYRFL